MKRYRKKRRTGLKLIALMVLLICGVVLYKTNGLKQELTKKEVKEEKLTVDIEGEEERTNYLEEQRAYQCTKRYIEELARTKLGLVYPDEIIFVTGENK